MSDALNLYQQAQNSKYLNVQGLDCHIGSQITEVAPFLDAQIPLGLNACCVFFINGQNLVIGIVKTGAQKIIHSAINNGK
jgi:hypothetical protein